MLSNDLALVIGLEAQLLDPTIRRSPDAVTALLADDFVEFGRLGGVYGRDEVVRSLAAEWNEEPLRLTTGGHELRALSAGVFLLTYRSVRTREGDEDLHTLRSSVWMLTDGRWRMVFHQGTPTSSSSGWPPTQTNVLRRADAHARCPATGVTGVLDTRMSYRWSWIG